MSKDLALRIEAVTVCVDYADFLEITLPHMLRAVDDLVVVTAPADERTRDLCKRHGVRALVTTAMHSHGCKFSLGAALDAGLAALPLSDWAAGPGRRHRPARQLSPDRAAPETGPGKTVRRRPGSLPGLACLAAVHSDTAAGFGLRGPVPAEFPGRRRIRFDGHGYMPCGFFQLWNAGATGYRDYPIHENGTAEGSDMLHAARFPRQYRELIPEIVGIQLETDTATDPVGVNWAGRRTAEFSAEGGPYRR